MSSAPSIIVDRLLEGGDLKSFARNVPEQKVYYSIVFCQGDDADEPFRILDARGEEAAIDYLAQWDYGHENEHSPESDEPWGSDDDEYHMLTEDGEYILSYNKHLYYISLTRAKTVLAQEK